MQNKGAIRLLAILLALASLYQLSFTFVTKMIESDASKFGNGDKKKEIQYLDSISSEVVYNFFYLRKYTYRECKEQEINFGLDLKGGMNVTLEISVVDVIRALSNYSTDPTFTKAIDRAIAMERESQEDFVTLFGKAFTEVDPNAKLAGIFSTVELKSRVSFNSTNEEVLQVISEETQNAITNSFNILRSRIDRFGVTQPNIQRLGNTGRILVELPGVKDPERVRKLLQGTAQLEFWETYNLTEIYQNLLDVNDVVKRLRDAGNQNLDSLGGLAADSTQAKADTSKASNLLSEIEKKDTAVNKNDSAAVRAKAQKDFPLFTVLIPSTTRDGKLTEGASVGFSAIKDTAKVNSYFNLPQVKDILPKDLKFLWTVKPFDEAGNFFQLVAIKVSNRDGKPPLDGGVITDARKEFGNSQATAEVTMAMNAEGAKVWARLTKENVGKQVAIVLDNYVYSFPVVNQEIKGGRSQITGNFTIQEAEDLANVLKSGKLPAPARIIEEAVVGPSLGVESIQAGLYSFILAFFLVLLYMGLYYNRAGWVADVALVSNLFFLFGVMASIGAVLTLPGIAGIVLTMGMAVDANVIIYERIREELRAGKGLRLAINDGYKRAYSAIIDGNLTTMLTGIILAMFGSGPVQGFATTLIIGICTSLFSAIFISRLIFIWFLDKNWTINFSYPFSANIFLNAKVDFIKIRKKFYYISGAVILLGIISLSFKGLNYGIDFTGGRTYVVRFDQPVRTDEVRSALGKVFPTAPEVKTFGSSNQVKITTKYKIDDPGQGVEKEIDQKLFEGLSPFFLQKLTYDDFSIKNQEIGVLSSQKVGPTIADDIKYAAVLAIFFALLGIFVYIAARFRNWKFGLGGVVSLFHDAVITISFFSIFDGILPFNLEIDQAFIAAILTIIGYSINDSVIIFDRIREYRTLHPKWELEHSINSALNSTLGRTLNTAGTTLITLLAMFIFGGEVIRGFLFALLVGISVGTYSSVLNATPVAYDFIMISKRKKEAREAALAKRK